MIRWELAVVRSVTSLVVVLVYTRILGKKQLSQLTFFDYVVGATIGSLTATASGNLMLQLPETLAALTVWTALPFLLGYLDLKSQRFHQLFDGTPSVLIKNGSLMEDAMARSRLSADDLMAMLRTKNAFRLADVEFAVLETDGQLSIQKKPDAGAVTLKSLGLVGQPGPGIPSLVIADGQWRPDVLRELGLTKDWIMGQLKNRGAKSVRDVMLAQVDTAGILYVDLYEDGGTLINPNQDRILAANIVKLAADLKTFSLQTDDLQAQKTYQQLSSRMTEVASIVSPYLEGEK